MFKVTIKAKTYEELQTKLSQLVGSGQSEAGHAVFKNHWGPAWDESEVKPTYDTREEDEILEKAYVHPESQSEEPTPAPKKRSAKKLADVQTVPAEDVESDGEGDSEPFLVTPSSTDGISGVSEANVSQPVGDDADLDSKGMPYNPKIHSAVKAKNKDGSWRARRGVDPTLVKQVEAQTTPVVAAPSMSGIPPLPTTNVVVPMPFLAPQAPAPVEASPVVAQPPAPAAPSVHDPIAPPQDSTKPAHTLETFQKNFMLTIANLVAAGVINQAYIETMKKHFGGELWDIEKKPEQVKEMFEGFVQYGFITRVG